MRSSQSTKRSTNNPNAEMQHNHLKHPKLYDRNCQLKIVGGSFIDDIALKIRAIDQSPSSKVHINIKSEGKN